MSKTPMIKQVGPTASEDQAVSVYSHCLDNSVASKIKRPRSVSPFLLGVACACLLCLPSLVAAESSDACDSFVGSPAFLELKEMNDNGMYGGEFRDGLRKHLVEPKCTRQQVDDAMVAFGFVYEPVDRVWCRPERNWFWRMVKDCEGYASFAFTDGVAVNAGASPNQ